jgi:hypothetical protein
MLQVAAAAFWRAPVAAAYPLERVVLRQLRATPATATAAVDGACNAVATWIEFECGSISEEAADSSTAPIRISSYSYQGTKTAAATAAAAAASTATATSIKQGLIHLDAPLHLAAGEAVRVSLRPAHEDTTLSAVASPVAVARAARPAPSPSSRHALLPAWHYTMLADAARNSAFDAAIRCVGAYKRLGRVSTLHTLVGGPTAKAAASVADPTQTAGWLSPPPASAARAAPSACWTSGRAPGCCR